MSYHSSMPEPQYGWEGQYGPAQSPFGPNRPPEIGFPEPQPGGPQPQYPAPECGFPVLMYASWKYSFLATPQFRIPATSLRHRIKHRPRDGQAPMQAPLLGTPSPKLSPGCVLRNPLREFHRRVPPLKDRGGRDRTTMDMAERGLVVVASAKVG